VTEQRGTPSLASAMSWTVGLRLLGMPLQLAVFVLIARLYSLGDVGIYAMANAVWQGFKGLGPLGLDVAAMRFGGELLAAGRRSDVQALEIGSKRVVVIANTVIASILALIGVVLILRGVTLRPSILLIVCVGIPIFALLGLQVGQLRARNLVRAAQVPESLIFNALAGALIVAASKIAPGALEWALAATVVSACVVVVLNSIRFRKLHDPIGSPLTPTLRASMQRSAVQMFLGQALVTTSARTGPIVIGMIAGSSSAALLEAATRLGQLASVSTWAAGIAASPLFSAAHAKGERRRLQDLVVGSSWLAFAPALAVVAVVVVFGKTLLHAFGGQFVVAYPTAILISVAAAVNAAGGLSATLLYMAGKERLVVYLTSMSLGVLLLSMVLLVPVLGLPGAGIAFVASALVRDGGASAILPRVVGVAPGVFSVVGLQQFWGKANSAVRAAVARR
jgi:O-antigen/teichoic acid export membrane protein